MSEVEGRESPLELRGGRKDSSKRSGIKKKKRKKQNKIKVKEKKVDEYRVENTVPRPVSLIFVVVVQHCAFFFF